MRISFAIAAAITAPVLLLTACTNSAPPKPLKGTVTEIEYKPAKKKVKKAEVKVTTCTTPRAKRVGKTTKTPRPTCTTKGTGRYVTKTLTVKGECYEVEVTLDNGRELDLCDEAVYRAVTIHGPYNSAIDYSKRRQLR